MVVNEEQLEDVKETLEAEVAHARKVVTAMSVTGGLAIGLALIAFVSGALAVTVAGAAGAVVSLMFALTTNAEARLAEDVLVDVNALIAKRDLEAQKAKEAKAKKKPAAKKTEPAAPKTKKPKAKK